MRASSLLIAAASILALLASCGAFSRDEENKERYLLDASRAVSEPLAASGDLEVRAFEVATSYAAKGFVYRRSEGRYESDYYNEFFTLPGEMLAGLTRNWLARSGLVATVQAGGSRVDPDYVLEGDLVELHGDFREPPGRAVIGMRLVLLDGKSDGLIFQREYVFDEPLADEKPASLVAGWSACLARLLAELEADLRRALAGR